MIGDIALFAAAYLLGVFTTPDGRIFLKLAVGTVIAFTVDAVKKIKGIF